MEVFGDVRSQFTDGRDAAAGRGPSGAIAVPHQDPIVRENPSVSI